MLLVVKRGREAEVERIFDKWDLHAVHIGEVTDDGMLRVKERGVVVAEIPNRALTDEAPVYRRPMSEPEYLRRRAAARSRRARRSKRPGEAGAARRRTTRCSRCSARRPSRSKRWVYRQYDHMVRTNTVNLPGLGAGVVRIKGTDRALAMSVDGNGRYCYLDPYRGAMLAVAEAARNVACAGARPLGATNCLNFGNPGAAGDHVAVRARRSKASARRAARSTCRSPAATSACTTRPTARRSIRRRSSASSACSSTPIASSAAGSRQSGDVDRAARRGPRRARRQRVSEGRARPGARRAAGARSRRRARAAGAARRRWPTSA